MRDHKAHEAKLPSQEECDRIRRDFFAMTTPERPKPAKPKKRVGPMNKDPVDLQTKLRNRAKHLERIRAKYRGEKK